MRHGAGVRAAAAERRDAAGRLVDALEAGDHGDLAALAKPSIDARAPSMSSMRAEPWASSVWIGICQPCQERALMPMSCSAMASRPDGHLLARGDDGVVFARVVAAARPRLHPGDELVGLAGHGRDDDGDLMAGVDLALDMAGDVADALDIGDGRAAEFHHETGHAVSIAAESHEAERLRPDRRGAAAKSPLAAPAKGAYR